MSLSDRYASFIHVFAGNRLPRERHLLRCLKDMDTVIGQRMATSVEMKTLPICAECREVMKQANPKGTAAREQARLRRQQTRRDKGKDLPRTAQTVRPAQARRTVGKS